MFYILEYGVDHKIIPFLPLTRDAVRSCIQTEVRLVLEQRYIIYQLPHTSEAAIHYTLRLNNPG